MNPITQLKDATRKGKPLALFAGPVECPLE